MASKSIKNLIVNVSTTGADVATKELKTLNTLLDQAAVSSKIFSNQLSGASRDMRNLALGYRSMSQAIDQSVASIRKFNNAVNGDTNKANKAISAYLDNVQLLDISLKELAVTAEKAAANVSKVGALNQLDEISDLVLQLVNSIEYMNGTLDDMSDTMRLVETNTGKAAGRLKDTKRYITDLEKTTNRGNETLDELARSFFDVGSGAQKAAPQVDNLNNKLRNLNGQGSQGARAFSKLAFSMNPLTATYAAIAINVYALSEAFRFLKEAASLDRLLNQTAQFSASISGINVQSLAQQMQQVSGGSLAMGEAVKQAVRGVSFNFMSDELLRLTDGARKASVALGRDFTDSLDRVIRGISKGEVELLDELGVVTRLDTAYKKYAASLGVTVEQLTDSQRKMALTKEVIGQLEAKYKGFDSAANSMERLGVATENLTNRTLILISRALDPAAAKLADFLEGLAPQPSAAKRAAESLQIYNKAIAAGRVDEAAIALYEYSGFMKEVRQQSVQGSAAQKAFNDQMTKTKESVDAVTTSVVLLVAWMNRALVVTAVTRGFGLLMASGLALNAMLRSVSMGFVAFTAAMRGGVGVLAALRWGIAITAGVFATFTAPIWGTVAVVAALVAGIAAFIEWISPGTLGAVLKAAGKAIGWLWDKIKEFADWIGETVGLKDFIEDMAGVETAADTTAASILELAEANRLAAQSAKELVDAQNAASIMNFGKNMGSAILPASSPAGKPAGPLATSEELEERERKRLEVAAEIARANKAYGAQLEEANTALTNINKNLGIAKTEYEEMAIIARKLSSETELAAGKINPETIQKARDIFESKKLDGLIPASVEFDNGRGFTQWFEAMDRSSAALAELGRQRDITEAKFATDIYGSDRENIKMMEEQIRLNIQELSKYAGVGDSVDAKNRLRLNTEIAILREKIKQAEIDEFKAELDRNMELTSARINEELKLRGSYESDILQATIDQTEAKIRALEFSKQDTTQLKQKVELDRIRLEYAKKREAIEMAQYERDRQLLSQQKVTEKAGTETERVASLQKELELEKQDLESKKSTMNPLEYRKASDVLSDKESSLAGLKDGAIFKDVSSVASGIAGLEGLTDLQSQFSSSVSDISSTYGDFLADMEGKGGSFVDYLSGNIDAMSQVMQASVSLAGQAFKTMSDEKIAGIDREIEAEKRRDGKSAESLAKIKALEAKKIKEEAKAKKASVIMSTAAGAMQAFAQMGPFGAPFAAAITAMGMLQLASIDRAANGQLAALNDGGGSSLSITGGNRSNEIDVNKKANAGELAYLQGMSGTGTANNFTPGKAVGGYARAGASIVVGESGPETITPAIPVNVSPAGQSGQQPAIVFSPVINASAVDTEGMESLLDRYSRQLFDSLEKEMNARNRSLESL